MMNVRRAIFPYGMARNSDGSWTFFNRNYKPVGVVTEDGAEWDEPRHKISLRGLGPKTLAKLDCNGTGEGERIYFYSDEKNPEMSPGNFSNYVDKLKILIGLQSNQA